MVTDYLNLNLERCSNLSFVEKAVRTPGQIEDLCDLLAEDWVGLGNVREMGDATQKFFRSEMEKTWGSKHLSVLSEDEATKWVMGVSIPQK